RSSLSSYFVAFRFLFTDPSTSAVYTLSLHDALPISGLLDVEHLAAQRQDGLELAIAALLGGTAGGVTLDDVELAECGILFLAVRSEEHTSELQSRENLVCRLLLEKKKKKNTTDQSTK